MGELIYLSDYRANRLKREVGSLVQRCEEQARIAISQHGAGPDELVLQGWSVVFHDVAHRLRTCLATDGTDIGGATLGHRLEALAIWCEHESEDDPNDRTMDELLLAQGRRRALLECAAMIRGLPAE